jgi:hypothetical protein
MKNADDHLRSLDPGSATASEEAATHVLDESAATGGSSSRPKAVRTPSQKVGTIRFRTSWSRSTARRFSERFSSGTRSCQSSGQRCPAARRARRSWQAWKWVMPIVRPDLVT